MRFEIRAGGWFLILLGLVGLSGAVFALGLVAGYEMARQNQPDLNQISSTYSLPNPPASGEKAAPVSEMSPAAAASPSVASAPMPPLKPPAPAVGEIPPAARTSPATVARLKPRPEAPAISRPAPGNENESDENSETASAPAAPARGLAPGAKPYNIQIEAVMDKSGADEMVLRLKTLGYSAQEMKVALNGQTWYRVRIGPYASADEANAAQNKLRAQYRQAYTTSH
jgi:cell division septation protein DedD